MRIGRTLIVTCALAVSAGMMCGTHGIAAAQEQRVDHITAATADNAVDEPIPSTLIGVGRTPRVLGTLRNPHPLTIHRMLGRKTPYRIPGHRAQRRAVRRRRPGWMDS